MLLSKFIGVLQPLIDMLTQNDPKITMVVLDAIKNILQAGDKINQRDSLCDVLEEMGLVDQLERLQSHQNEEVHKGFTRFEGFVITPDKFKKKIFLIE